MKATETNIKTLFEGTKQYLVPLFQRPYSWKQNDWQVLWDDILDLYGSDRETDDRYCNHFMGSIVIIPASESQSITQYLLIDGQQRLTTLLLMFAAIRDVSEAQAASTSQPKSWTKLIGKIRDLLINKWEEDSPNYYTLLPTQLNQDCLVFQSIINPDILQSSTAPIPESSGIKKCYDFFKKKIESYLNSKIQPTEIKATELDEFVATISIRLFLIEIKLDLQENAYLVFESLNAKGTPLTQADLVRNYIFMGIDRQEQELAYQQHWQPMESLLGKDMTEFIRYFLMKDGHDIKQTEVYVHLKRRMASHKSLGFLTELHRFSKYYSAILNPQQIHAANPKDNPIISQYLDHLKRWDVSTIHPFLLACYHDWQTQKIQSSEFIAILQTLENFLLRRFICGVQTRGLNRIFALLYDQVCKKLALNGQSFLTNLKDILVTKDYPHDDDFLAHLPQAKLYGSGKREKGSIILESIEQSFGHQEKIDLGNLTIEHIMPQNLNPWWKEHWGENWEVDHETYKDTLGNLTLTAYNSHLSNSDFPTKKGIFLQSNLQLNKYFADVTSWRKENIEARSQALAQIALQIWPYLGSPTDSTRRPITRTKGIPPKTLRIDQKEYNVKTWRDVLQQTLEFIISTRDPGIMDQIVERFSKFMGRDQAKFRETRQLSNGIFFEVNFSADSIQSLCAKLLETAEIPISAWEVTLQKSDSDDDRP